MNTSPNKESGQQPCVPGQFQCCARRPCLFTRDGTEGSLQGMGEVGCRVGQRHRSGQIKPRRPSDHHWPCFGGGVALIDEFECRCTRCGNQDVGLRGGIERGQPPIIRALNREHGDATVDHHWPAPAQRVDRTGRVAWIAQKANSVTMGI
ncbi:MAG: hypothetical protein RLZZ366_1238 [Pseudomonadota bacterium]